MHGNGNELIPDRAQFYASSLQAALDSALPLLGFAKKSNDDRSAKLYCTFPTKYVLRDAANSVLWEPIITTSFTVTNKKDQSSCRTGLKSLSTLITEFEKKI